MILITNLQNLQQENGVINDQNNTVYGEGNENGTTVKFETQVIKSNRYDYSDAYILVTGNITVNRNNNDVEAAFKNCAPFTRWVNTLKTMIIR